MTKFWCLSLLLCCGDKSRSDALVLNIVVWRNKYWQYFDTSLCLFVVTKFKNKEFPFCCSPYLLMVSSIYQLVLYCFSLHIVAFLPPFFLIMPAISILLDAFSLALTSVTHIIFAHFIVMQMPSGWSAGGSLTRQCRVTWSYGLSRSSQVLVTSPWL